MPSSAASTAPVSCPFSSLIGTGMISPAKNPSSVLAAARWCDCNANASISSRVMPHLSASTCATQNWMPSVLFVFARKSGLNGPIPPRAFDDIGARVIDSTPHAIPMSYAPAITPCATKCAACCDDPHCRSTLVAGTLHGRPRRDPRVAGDVAALLARLRDAAADDVVDERGIDVVALDHRAQHEPEQIGRVPAGQRTLALAECGARAVDDHCFACHNLTR